MHAEVSPGQIAAGTGGVDGLLARPYNRPRAIPIRPFSDEPQSNSGPRGAIDEDHRAAAQHGDNGIDPAVVVDIAKGGASACHRRQPQLCSRELASNAAE